MKYRPLIVISVLVLSMLACRAPGGQSQNPASQVEQAPLEAGQLPPGDAARGEALFSGQAQGEVQCHVCHSLEAGQTLVGPSLAGMSAAAATRQEGMSAEDYLYQSIVAPDAYVLEGFHGGMMPSIYTKHLDAQQLADLVAFLMSR